MGKLIRVFVSHSSEDKESFIEPIVEDLRNCNINVWIDEREILPGENLRNSIFKEGLDKVDIVLIFFTQQSLKSSWVDKEIKHLLKEEAKKENNFDLNKIISIYDSKETYKKIEDRYPELTDDLLHLMTKNYTKKELGKLISAIWNKYMSLQGGDVDTQRQLLSKKKQIIKFEKETQTLKSKVEELKLKNSNTTLYDEFKQYKESEVINNISAIKQETSDNKGDLFPEFLNLIETDKLEHSELLLLHYIIDTRNVKLMTGEIEKQEVLNINKWEKSNDIKDILSKKYAWVLRSFELRGFTEISEVTFSDEPYEVKLRDEIVENILDLPNNVLSKIDEAVKSNFYEHPKEVQNIKEFDLPF